MRRERLDPAAERAAAIAALDAAAAATNAAYEAWNRFDLTQRQEDRARLAWEIAHEAQNRAAVRLHAANRAVGRMPRDVTP